MTVRSVVLVLLSIFVAVFLILNWQGITAPVPVNILFKESQAPLGLILIIFFGVLWVAGIAWSLMQQASTLFEIRRAYKQADANKTLADHAELSRLEQVRQNLTDSMGQVTESVAKIEKALCEKEQTEGEQEQIREDRLQALETQVQALLKNIEELSRTQQCLTQSLDRCAQKLEVEPVHPEPAPEEEKTPEPAKQSLFKKVFGG